jgi:hypothetical protein
MKPDKKAKDGDIKAAGGLERFWKAQPLAVLSLVISGFVAWNSWVKPFRPVGSAGSVILQGSKGTLQLRMIVPIRIVNDGASVGTIEDLAVRCTFQSQTTGESNRCSFFPAGFYLPDYLSKKVAQRPEVEFYKELFAPILLLPRQEFSELVQFGIEGPPCDPKMPSRYRAEVLLRTREGPWITIDSFDGTFDKSTVEKLTGGTDIQINSSTYEERRQELLK